MFGEITDLQTKRMSEPFNSSLWLQEWATQDPLEKYALEQDLYLAQRTQQNGPSWVKKRQNSSKQ